MKKILLAICTVSLATLFVYGCSKPVKTVDWYKGHEKERKEVLTECNNNPGELAMTPNCQNASTAETAINASKRGNLQLKPLTAEDFKKSPFLKQQNN